MCYLNCFTVCTLYIRLVLEKIGSEIRPRRGVLSYVLYGIYIVRTPGVGKKSALKFVRGVLCVILNVVVLCYT